ncbi:DUF3352 domain-containing protein [Arsenicicoccus piscis]|uniref:DUF3352 domain-containing protein n=1 Tax=Arsenicicoccus piscis TaxID=673954 RepID=A0ABQ6HSN1_9MICO|nr:DUF3352 domain-containing protein [Arsenicicoccus piscis]MCH8626594.1 DUF3352 domain-containing protein [Arsenicicoccus piscis]GMA21245.1 hypothetical protein GCM10025862_32660 [Arsenicicoccus piscis]
MSLDRVLGLSGAGPSPDRPAWPRRVFAWLLDPGRRTLALVLAAWAFAAICALGVGLHAALTRDDGVAAVLPRDTVAVVELDTDPSLSQKIAAFQLSQRLPLATPSTTPGSGSTSAGGHGGAAQDDGDWRRRLLEGLLGDRAEGVDFTRDVDPWLGRHVSLALMSSGIGGRPVPVLALEVRDEAQARAALPRLGLDLQRHDVVSADGYLLVVPQGRGELLRTARADGSLLDNRELRDDRGDLGDRGVLWGWLDGNAVAAADLTELAAAGSGRAGSSTGTAAGAADGLDRAAQVVGGFFTWAQGASARTTLSSSGRTAVALRLGPDHVELAGVSRGAATSVGGGAAPAVGLVDLPADTAAGLAVSGLDQTIGSRWASWVSEADDALKARDPAGQTLSARLPALQRSLGVALPQDLQTLVGSQTTVALSREGLGDGDGQGGGKGTALRLALRSTTDATSAKAIVGTLVEHLARQSGRDVATLPVHQVSDGSTFVAASTPQYGAALANPGQGGGQVGGQGGGATLLGSSDALGRAVRDLGAGEQVYLDLAVVEPLLRQHVPAELRPFADGLRAAGWSRSQRGAGAADFALRLVPGE